MENNPGWSIRLTPGATVITGNRAGLRGLRDLIGVAIEKGEAHAVPLRAEEATMTVRCTEEWESVDERLTAQSRTSDNDPTSPREVKARRAM